MLATAATDNAILVGPNYMRISEGAQSIDWAGFNATSWTVGAFATNRLGLQDAAVTNFANTGLPFGGDFTGAFQWDVTLNPNETIILTSAFTLNGAAIPEPTSVCVLGFAAIGLLARRRRA